MRYVQGNDRYQSKISTHCLDETVEADNPVRVIDAFVDSLPLDTFGFRLDYREKERPAHHPADLLKLQTKLCNREVRFAPNQLH